MVLRGSRADCRLRGYTPWLTELMLKSGTRSARHRGPGEPVAPLPRQRLLRARPPPTARPSRSDRRLVEPEVVDLAGHLAVLDQVDAVPGQAGQQQRRRVDLADVPQAGQQQPALGVRRPSPPASGPPPPSRTRLSDRGRDRQPGQRRRCAGWWSAASARRRAIQSVGAERQPVVEDRLVVARRSARSRTARTPGPGSFGSLRRVSGSVGQRLADPGAAARLGEHRAALGRVPGRRPTTAGRSAGRPPRSAAAASRTARRAARPGARPSPAAAASSASSAAGSTSLKSRVDRARPRRARPVRGLGVQLQRPVRLVVAQPQPRRGAQVASRSARGWRSRTARGRPARARAKASPSAGREVGEHVGARSRRARP